MRTRTLLLLAVACGLAILLAGGIQLLRVGSRDARTGDLRIGDGATAADLRVTVVGADERDGRMRVDLRVGGVADDDVLDGFRLIVPGAALEPLTPAQAGPASCAAVTVAERNCSLVFGTASVEGSPRVLLLRRGEDQRRWTLV